MKKTLISALLVAVTAAPVLAKPQQETHVFCSKVNTFGWHWLPKRIEASGYWKRVYAEDEIHYATYFVVEKNQFQALSDQCANYHPTRPLPRPANSIFNAWHAFAWYDQTGELVVSTDDVTVSSIPDESDDYPFMFDMY